MKTLIAAISCAALIGFAIPSAAQVVDQPGTYSTVGGTTYGPNGVQSTVGNTTYVQGQTGSSTYSTVGHTTYGPNGNTYTQAGQTNYGSNGSTSTTVGNTTYISGPNGRTMVCTKVGSQTYCN